jgi:hypothetical protein
MAKVQLEQKAPSTFKLPGKFNSVTPSAKPPALVPDASKIKMPKPAFKK